MVLWLSLFIVSALFKSSVESLNRLNKAYSYTFERYLYTRILLSVVFYLIIVEHVTNYALILVFVSFSLLLFGMKTKTKTFKRKWKAMMQFFSRYLFSGLLIALIVLLTYQTQFSWLFVVYGASLIVVFILIYLLILKKVLPFFFHLIPIEYPYDNSNLLTNYPTLYNHIYMVKGKKIRLPMNALFTGFFKRERIYISDALLSRLNSHALKAIIFHELGHYHHKHLIKRIVIMVISLSFFTLSFYLGAQHQSFIDALLVSSMSLYTFSTGLEVLIYPFMHRQEYEADLYACKATSKYDFKRALKSIHQANREPNYHRLYQTLFTTHPSYDMRIKHIDQELEGV